MRHYDKSGNSLEALTTPATEPRTMMGDGFRTGCTYKMRFVWVNNTHATQDATIQIYDQLDAGAGATAANERFSFLAPANTVTMVTIPATGIEFKINVTACTTNGTVAIYQCGCGGYEEGQG